MPYRKPLAGWGRQQPPQGSQVNWGHPVSRGLTCRLVLNETAGGNKLDIASGRLAAMSAGGVVSANTILGKGLAFDGTTGKLRVASALVKAYPITLMGWAYNSPATQPTRIMTLADEATDNEWLTIDINTTTGVANAACAHLGSSAVASGTVDIRGRWHQVTGVFASATDRRVYVDGILAGSNTTSIATDFSTLDSVVCGALSRSTILYGGGVVTNLSVWSRALSPNEILALFNSPFGDIIPPRRRVISSAPSTSKGRMFLAFP